MPRPSPLLRFFRQHEGPRIHKWVDYFEIYHRHLARFRDRPVRFLEIGVNQGGSLEMWKDYLHPESRIVGMDVDTRCRRFAGGNVSIEIGDQEDRDFLGRIADTHGPFDVVIDDGGHTMAQQLTSFEVLYPRMTADGCYLVEDTHTSYWPQYGGGHRREGSFVEHAKVLADQVNAWHSRSDDFVVDEVTRTTLGVHFYTSLVVVERRAREKPRSRRRGTKVFDVHDSEGRPVAGGQNE